MVPISRLPPEHTIEGPIRPSAKLNDMLPASIESIEHGLDHDPSGVLGFPLKKRNVFVQFLAKQRQGQFRALLDRHQEPFPLQRGPSGDGLQGPRNIPGRRRGA